jgi:uncharacterized protein (TIGR02172 family)
MQLGKPIALGRTAEIYVWGEGQILKLFRKGVSADGVEREARIAQAIHAAGLPVPAVGEVVEINGRLGLIYERVEGTSMLEILSAKPWTLFRYARLLAELQADIHARIMPGLPSQRKRLENKIRAAEALPPELQEVALKALDRMPDGDRLCHGDFHPDNVLITMRGSIIIDWVNATSGNPLADVARTSLLLTIGDLPPGTTVRWLLNTLRRLFYRIYLKRYFQLRPGDRGQLRAWQPVIAAARLSENIPQERNQLLAIVKAGLSIEEPRTMQ